MRSEDILLASVVVAAVAFIVATILSICSVTIASRAARSAAASAGAARTSADAAVQGVEQARRSADSAASSADTALKSLELARKTFDRQDAPDFTIIPREPEGTTWSIDVEMIAGPPSIKVEAVWFGESKRGEEFGAMAGGALSSKVQCTVGSKLVLDSQTVPNSTRNEMRVVLICEDEDDENRSWPFVREVQWNAPAPPQVW